MKKKPIIMILHISKKMYEIEYSPYSKQLFAIANTIDDIVYNNLTDIDRSDFDLAVLNGLTKADYELVEFILEDLTPDSILDFNILFIKADKVLVSTNMFSMNALLELIFTIRTNTINANELILKGNEVLDIKSGVALPTYAAHSGITEDSFKLLIEYIPAESNYPAIMFRDEVEEVPENEVDLMVEATYDKKLTFDYVRILDQNFKPRDLSTIHNRITYRRNQTLKGFVVTCGIDNLLEAAQMDEIWLIRTSYTLEFADFMDDNNAPSLKNRLILQVDLAHVETVNTILEFIKDHHESIRYIVTTAPNENIPHSVAVFELLKEINVSLIYNQNPYDETDENE